MPVNRRTPEWKKIKPFAGVTVLYGFRSRATSTDQATLGHVDITPAQDFNKLVIAPNNCKPHSASKRGATGSTGGLIDETKIATAVTSGWKIKWGYPPRNRRSRNNNKNIKLTIGTLKYGYIRASDNLYDQLAAFGHALITNADNGEVYYGCQFPVPPKMAVVVATSGKTVSSYAEPTKIDDVVSMGGRLIHPGAYTEVHLANLISTASAGGTP